MSAFGLQGGPNKVFTCFKVWIMHRLIVCLFWSWFSLSLWIYGHDSAKMSHLNINIIRALWWLREISEKYQAHFELIFFPTLEVLLLYFLAAPKLASVVKLLVRSLFFFVIMEGISREITTDRKKDMSVERRHGIIRWNKRVCPSSLFLPKNKNNNQH